MEQSFFILPKKYKDEPHDQPIATVQQAIWAVHDVLRLAAGAPTDVVVLCRTLRYELREKLWAKLTGKTFGEQLREVLDAGGKVRVLLAADAEKDTPMSADVLSLREVGNFELVATGDMQFFRSFPHFTLGHTRGTSKPNPWFTHVEPEHEDFDVAAIDRKLEQPISSFLLVRSDAAAHNGEWLMRHFMELFEGAKKAAQDPQTGARYVYYPATA